MSERLRLAYLHREELRLVAAVRAKPDNAKHRVRMHLAGEEFKKRRKREAENVTRS